MTIGWSTWNLTAIIMSALAILVSVAAFINIRRALRTVNRMIAPPPADQPQTSTGPADQWRPQFGDPWLPKPPADPAEEILPAPEMCTEPGCESESHAIRTSHIRRLPEKKHLLWWT